MPIHKFSVVCAVSVIGIPSGSPLSSYFILTTGLSFCIPVIANTWTSNVKLLTLHDVSIKPSESVDLLLTFSTPIGVISLTPTKPVTRSSTCFCNATKILGRFSHQ